jgi:hypothetical protein
MPTFISECVMIVVVDAQVTVLVQKSEVTSSSDCTLSLRSECMYLVRIHKSLRSTKHTHKIHDARMLIDTNALTLTAQLLYQAVVTAALVIAVATINHTLTNLHAHEGAGYHTI